MTGVLGSPLPDKSPCIRTFCASRASDKSRTELDDEGNRISGNISIQVSGPNVAHPRRVASRSVTKHYDYSTDHFLRSTFIPFTTPSCSIPTSPPTPLQHHLVQTSAQFTKSRHLAPLLFLRPSHGFTNAR